MKSFTTHRGDIVTGEKLKQALNNVANDKIANVHRIRNEDMYAPHVNEEQKDENLRKGLELAEQIRRGEASGLWLAQLINTKLTGECIGMLRK